MNDHTTISLYRILKLFSTPKKARLFLERRRWGNSPVCPFCGHSHSVPRVGKREGRVRSFVTGDTSKLTLQGLVGACVERGAVVNTDEFSGYGDLGERGYVHNRVNHSAKLYVDGKAYTNGIESVWSLLKRGFYGTFHKFTLEHLQRYVDEFDFRWNEGLTRFGNRRIIQGGCGSTAVTAKGLGRNYIGIDISPEYCELAKERIEKDSAKYAQQSLFGEKPLANRRTEKRSVQLRARRPFAMHHEERKPGFAGESVARSQRPMPGFS